MRTNKKKIGLLILIILILSGAFYLNYSNINSKQVNTEESEEDEEYLVRLVLYKYGIAAKNHDVDELFQLSLDLSWPDRYQFKKNLKALDDKISKFETINLEKIEKDLYQATVLVEAEFMARTEMKFPVLNLNGRWKIIVGQDLDENQQATDPTSNVLKSAEFYKDYFSNLKR
ncbi:MAG TPA: hypothetical protein IAA29_07440 [Candidatus Paenibacillus intestinavium]|nr:hypothetical protein [Candidatus Paenibacillus intestinavium]